MKKENYHPYLKKVFWYVFLLTFGITLVATAALYYFLSGSIIKQAQQDLEAIAVNTAAAVPVDIHEQLISPDDQKSAGYIQIEDYFKSVMVGNPKIDDIYTLRPTSQAHVMTFVVSGSDTSDDNHNNFLEDNEVKAMLGETFDTEGVVDLERGLHEPSYDQRVTFDKWGAWLSGYAPLKDAAGKTVAVLGVDYSADTLTAERTELLWVMFWVALIMLPICMVSAALLARWVEKPFRTMVEAMHHITHGEMDYKIPVTKNEDSGLLAEFFNTMKSVQWEAAKRQVEKDKRE